MENKNFLKNIVWASYGPDISENALNYALYFARAFDSKIYSLYVKPTTYNPEKECSLTKTEKLLNKEWNEFIYNENLNQIKCLQKRVSKQNLKTTNMLIEGIPCFEIIKFANNKLCDLVVIDRGKTFVQKTTLYVVENSSAPVLTVDPSDEFREIKNILVPVDIHNIYSEAFNFALQISTIFKSEVTQLNIQNKYDKSLPPEVVERKHGDAYFKLAGKDKNMKIKKVVIDMDNISEGILKYTDSNPVDLIVLQTFSGKKQDKFHSNGSVAERVLKKTDCPVLTIKTD